MATTFVNTTISPSETYVNNGAAATGGAGYQDRFTIGGVWNSGDTITITFTNNGNSVQTQVGAGYVTGIIPTFVFTFNQKVYALAASTAYFSAVDDATTWNNPTGNNNGFVELSDWYATAENLIAAAPYQGRLAFFSRFTTQIYIIDADPTKWQQQQILTNIGTLAPFSVQNLGDLDVMFLSDTGIRSLRARDLTLNAFVNDLGSPIDQLVISNIEQNGVTSSEGAQAIVDPGTGRYWLFLNNVIYVLSYYPTNQITAWSTYEPSYDAMTDLVLTATAASTSQINLNWGQVTSGLGAVTYNLYRSTLSGFWPLATTPIATGLTGITYANTGLTQNTTYYYYAVGVDINGGEILSNEASATTQGTGSQPGSFVLTATTISHTEIDLSWPNPTGNTPITYNVYASTNSNFTPTDGSNSLVLGQASSSTNTYQHTGLTAGTQWYYYVKAINGIGSSFSNEASARTIPTPAPLIPYMTLDNAPSGIATASTEAYFPAFYGFQFGIDITDLPYYSWTDGNQVLPYTFPMWIRYDFPSGQQATTTQYVVAVTSSTPSTNTAVILQGSNDGGTTWTNLDSETITGYGTLGNYVSQFNVSTAAYSSYRLYVSSSDIAYGQLRISLQLVGYI